ncbi:MAG TPA: bifunctional lysylphosphatidylglycerol flippase/synthetase MprF [Gemmatimonadaceae bacterium]|nr:bifunctional lysylphosphatidylglycerol flippase/synthetase MprF [Gemmatimonadaceae bacterium]
MTRHYLPISIIAALIIAAMIYWQLREPVDRLVRLGGTMAAAVVPRMLAITTFLAGTILLFSGATPPIGHRLYWVNRFLPLPVVEAAHFFGSIAGVGLLLLARGIQRRLDAAYHLTVALLAVAMVFTLLKGFDYEEAIFLSVMLAVLVPNRRYFYRKASIIEERFTPTWIAAIGLIVLASIVLGYVSYHGIPGEMFWEFELDQTAPRFLRATVGVVLVLLIFSMARLLRPAKVRAPMPAAEDIERARPIVAATRDASANLVVLGDKAILFAPTGQCFLMYAVSGRSWIALGDPVGRLEEWEPLATQFIDLAVRHGGWPVFYKVSRDHIGMYLDFGLSVVKLGEEARVPLTDFSLDGAHRRNLRRVWRKAIDDGCSFDVLETEESIEPVLSSLRTISDEWLEAKKTREKSFSLGRFRDDYVLSYPVGVVKKNATIVAFANVWTSGCHEELEVDLMRYNGAAPPGVMRYLLTEFMIWGKRVGYRWFNLGMAPLSGLRETLVAPLWYQIGVALYGRSERFYNFQGIRSFKEWFHPQWEPKYLANPGGAIRPLVIANVAALIAGGYEGVLRK